MPMNARLLRPTAPSGFNPKSISGLAQWLDASDASTLTLGSGAVSAWADKSGNGRNASQSTPASRPTTTTVNGKTALLFDGTDDGLNFTGTSRTDETWIIAAAQTADQSGQRQILSDGGNGTGMSATKGVVKFLEVAFGGFTEGTNRLRVQYSATPSALMGPGVFTCVRSAADGGFVFIDGTQRTGAVSPFALSFSSSAADTMQRIGYYSSSLFQFQGWIGEILCWNRALSAAERNAVEVYLGRKWGIAVTSVPAVTNLDAQNWINRVYANGGAVSASTASAVNTFCNAIDTAGIRDRFYRLNLFAGTGLNACLVPLYRGQSRTGTQFGNTTDTNVGPFVSGDYVETGASGGLTSNGTSKYLNTGFKADTLTQTDRHMSMVGVTTGANSSKYFLGMDNFGCGSNAFWGILTGNAVTNFMVRAQAAASNSTSFSSTGGYIVLSGNGSAAAYADGASAVTGLAGAYTAPNLDIYTHALNRCGTSIDYTAARLRSYSIGAAMTAGQVTSFYNAMLAFNTALSRA